MSFQTPKKNYSRTKIQGSPKPKNSYYKKLDPNYSNKELSGGNSGQQKISNLDILNKKYLKISKEILTENLTYKIVNSSGDYFNLTRPKISIEPQSRELKEKVVLRSRENTPKKSSKGGDRRVGNQFISRKNEEFGYRGNSKISFLEIISQQQIFQEKRENIGFARYLKELESEVKAGARIRDMHVYGRGLKSKGVMVPKNQKSKILFFLIFQKF